MREILDGITGAASRASAPERTIWGYIYWKSVHCAPLRVRANGAGPCVPA